MDEERMRILKMLEEGKISAEEAAKLLEALGEEAEARPAGKNLNELGPSACGATAAHVIEGSGNVVTEERPMSGFNRVSLTGSGELIITQGKEESLTVEADDSLMRYIKTEIKGGMLILGFTNEAKNKSIRPTKPIKFNLNVKEVTGLNLSGSGSINTPSLETDRLEIVISGSGDVRIDSLTAQGLVARLSGSGQFNLAGQAGEQDIHISGSGHYRAGQLKSRTAMLGVIGSGNATVWVNDTLDVQISGSGNVQYYGSPSVSRKILGSGRLTSLGNP